MKAIIGGPLPPGDKFGVSVYLPTWEDTIAWARRDPDLLAKLETGYPRFFVPLAVQGLSERLLQRGSEQNVNDNSAGYAIGFAHKLGLLCPSEYLAKSGRDYLRKHSEDISILHVSWDGQVAVVDDSTSTTYGSGFTDIHVVVYPQELAAEGKAFWQHTGYGISTRCATFWLENAPFLHGCKATCMQDFDVQVKKAEEANTTLRRRILDLLSKTIKVEVQDVYLYPTGMSAISHTAAALQNLKRDKKTPCRVVVFGFLYVDTFKVLSKVHGFGCSLYSYSNPADLDVLEKDLNKGLQIDALFTEFPGNPLLASVDLDRLHKLSRQHNFALVVDDTVATSVNVDILWSCDIICTSLTKMFSGGCNVMGGSVVLNRHSPVYESMQRALSEKSADTYFPDDVLVMERNSRDFESRVIAASKNAEHMAEKLSEHSTVAKVFYPKGSETQSIYDRYKSECRGYGYLLSVRFVHPAAAIAFHDALDVAKGPSLGTRFTLCSAYTLYAHYSELEWAAEFGVDEHLVRISVGVESEESLDRLIQTALDAAASA